MTKAADLSKTGSLVNTDGQLSLTTGVTGILPVANGGTGASSYTATQWTTTGSDIYYNTGNVGIGTSSPAQKFEVYNAATNSQCYGVFRNNRARNAAVLTKTTNGGFYTGTSVGTDTLCWQVYDESAGERMRIDSSGNLGLGVTPSAWASSWKALQISNRSLAQTGAGAGDWTMAFNAVFDSTDSRWEYQYTGDSAVRYSQTGAGVHAWYTAPSGTAGNAITFTQAMTLDASGRLLVGTTSATSNYNFSSSQTVDGPAGILVENINTGTSASSVIKFKNSGATVCYAGLSGASRATYGTLGANVFVSGYTDSTAGATIFVDAAGPITFGTNATERARISAAGGFSVGTTADPGAGAIYATGNITAYYSDDRLKTKLGGIENALDKVKSLSGFYYEANQTAQDLGYQPVREVGVSAQQVQAVLPEVVKPAPIDQQYLTVDYERLVPLLIEAIKELEEKVAKLEAK